MSEKTVRKREYVQASPTAETISSRQYDEAPALTEHEQWLLNNGKARELVERGLSDLAAGRVHTGLSFVQYADDVSED